MTPKLLTMRVCIPFILVLIFAAFGFYVPEEENMSEIVFSHMPPNGRTGAPG